jgi:hypothetical protein
MFRSTPAAEPAPDVMVPPEQLVPLSALALDLPVPAESWPVYLHERNIPIVVDDIGRDAISRAAARQLFTEHCENQVRARELVERQERQAIEQDRQWRATLYRGVPWWMTPDGISPAQVWAAADRDAGRRECRCWRTRCPTRGRCSARSAMMRS